MDIELDNLLPKKIRVLLQEFVNKGIIGLSRMKKLRVASNNNLEKHNSYSFILEIPYAGAYLNWEVIFSNEDLTFAPDFDFINDQFMTDPDIDVIENHLPSLLHWDIDNSLSLFNVVTEIFQLYKKYQVDRLQVNTYSRQIIEYSVLSEKLGIPEENVEVHIDPNDCVHFLILLPINTQALPSYMGKYFDNNGVREMSNPGESTITLRVSYMGQNKTQTGVWLSPRLEEILSSKTVNLPPYVKDYGLVKYIPAVLLSIQEKLELISKNYRLKKLFINTMLSHQGKSVVEYDSLTFGKITLLLEEDDNYCLVCIQLGRSYEKPQVQLRSLFCEKNNRPFNENLQYGYTAGLGPDDLVKRILGAVRQFLRNNSKENKNSIDNEVNNVSYADALK